MRRKYANSRPPAPLGDIVLMGNEYSKQVATRRQRRMQTKIQRRS